MASNQVESQFASKAVRAGETQVKKFDSRLKVYDGEGIAARAGEGISDTVLALGIDDSNMVGLVFDITDLA